MSASSQDQCAGQPSEWCGCSCAHHPCPWRRIPRSPMAARPGHSSSAMVFSRALARAACFALVGTGPLDEAEVATRVEVVLRHPGVMLQTLTGSPPAQWVQGPAGRLRGKEPGLPPGRLKRAGPVSLLRHSPKHSHDQKELESTLRSQGFKQGKVTHGRARLQGKGLR